MSLTNFLQFIQIDRTVSFYQICSVYFVYRSSLPSFQMKNFCRAASEKTRVLVFHVKKLKNAVRLFLRNITWNVAEMPQSLEGVWNTDFHFYYNGKSIEVLWKFVACFEKAHTTLHA